MSTRRFDFLLSCLLGLSLLSVACGPSDPAVREGDEDLTSKAAVERGITIKGYVYVDPQVMPTSISNAVQRQVRTAFGPLRIAKISVDDRELKNNVDASTFTTEELEVARRTSTGEDTGTDLTEGGANAQGVLKLINDAKTTEEVLTKEVGLRLITAKTIVKQRPFATLSALQTAGVEPDPLQSLLSYAKLNGFVEGVTPTLVVVKKIKRIGYTYKARGLVQNSLANKTSFSLTLLMGYYQNFVEDILKDCVEDYEHDRDFASSFWYVWSPNRYTCKTLIEKEQAEIEKARKGLAQNQISEIEHDRRYLPVTVELEPAAPPRTTYPEYDRLLGADDPAKSKVVVYQIVGQASHDGDPVDERFENDLKFAETFKELSILADTWSSLRVAPQSSSNPLSFTYKEKTYTGTFQEVYQWVVNQTNFPTALPSDERRAFRRAIHDNIFQKWITLEVPLLVKDGRNSKPLTLEIRLYYGTDASYSVKNIFREAFKNGDVVLYMGHSYIGSGPQDPNNYSPYDFSEKYQILFFQSCVSFNYYGQDYFDLKIGGSKNLDLITNGVESYVVDGGKTMGQFIVALFEEKRNTWLSILEKIRVSSWAGLHDPNRNVDGEQDNTYDPSVHPLEVNGTTP